MTQQSRSRISNCSSRLKNWLNECDPEKFLAIQHEADYALQTNLLDADGQQGFLSIGLPEPCFSGPSSFCNCLFWFPQGLPTGSSLHLASSRLGRQLGSKSPLFDAIRTLALHFNCESHFLTTHPGNTLDDYVDRLQVLFGVPVVRCIPFPKNLNSEYFVEVLNSNQTQYVCHYGPLDGRLPGIDELMIQSASEVRILSGRPNGKVVEQSLTRLQQAEFHACRTLLLIDSRLTCSKVTETMRELGATDWWLYNDYKSESSKSNHGAVSEKTDGQIFSLVDFTQKTDVADFLIHWTRQFTGPWPDQTKTQFFDELILGVKPDHLSRISSLCRIVAMRTLIANGTLNRSNTPVVCFSDSSIARLSQQRVFRSHLNRWDFELCGIAIRKSVLEGLGAKPVIYGDEDTWSNLSHHQRPYFQIASSNSGKTSVDWTNEKEHRICGNVMLDSLHVSDAFLFVETYDEAQTIAPLSRWPVVVLAE